ncbi:glycine/betaine ABC transporter permease [Paenibacillus sp. FSL H7-0357]|uniref:ABC transporter permease n=1 Tax=unclassified Paenibacillus TaxID=185978 RepID=UPI0004F6E75C|nr:ABC transporter permease [Paenibacillus sp. FSL H7-0357]AIQ18473.1 glycine/betaine ABC transporter permease [Paenibacillus sp. FSL H7-0357]
MIEYIMNHPDKWAKALVEHLEIVGMTLLASLLLASILTLISMTSKMLSRFLVHLFSIIYSIPSVALFAMMIPVTGLGKTTAITVLVVYNQYLLLRNFFAGLNGVDPAIIEAATGIGMCNLQVLYKIRLPLSIRAFFTGIRLAVVSTIGMATIAAFINAGGLGDILFDGLRTMNVYKIVWGSVLSAGMAVGVNALLVRVEKSI